MTKNIKLRDGGSWLNLTPIYGNGFPQGVVSAPVGTTYVDTAATNGAVAWVKATGSSTTGWVVSVGDTGWRNVSSLLVNGFTCNAAHLRRINNTVHFRAIGINSTSATATTFMTMPGGFTTNQRIPILATAGATGTSGLLHVGQIVWDNTCQLPTGLGGAGYFTLSFVAHDPYPTTLPGTAI